MPKPILICDNLVKIYKVADLEVVALQGLDLEVAPGEMIAIVGASGSGTGMNGEPSHEMRMSHNGKDTTQEKVD